MTASLIPFSPACERNKDPILSVITDLLSSVESVLEIGSGTAQHAVYFAASNPSLRWQTSDLAENLEGIRAQLANAELTNTPAPLELDVTRPEWFASAVRYPLVYTANTLHIMPWTSVQALFAQLPKVLERDGYFVCYGPFKYAECFTSDSNRAFDARLRSRGVGSGIRDFEAVATLAQSAGMVLVADHTMPANNQCLIFRRQA
ncbi:DUF938 domain-containing protein [Arenicella chitinivorans]|uniref:DUF938 domain-containing protein n=1 Tax=Arenicella chitinivorans TaxID=1329800 RepID=UPI001672C166|nr:DUF938 domain-containing protein [Arenicella chitinivorans]